MLAVGEQMALDTAPIERHYPPPVGFGKRAVEEGVGLGLVEQPGRQPHAQRRPDVEQHVVVFLRLAQRDFVHHVLLVPDALYLP